MIGPECERRRKRYAVHDALDRLSRRAENQIERDVRRCPPSRARSRPRGRRRPALCRRPSRRELAFGYERLHAERYAVDTGRAIGGERHRTCRARHPGLSSIVALREAVPCEKRSARVRTSVGDVVAASYVLGVPPPKKQRTRRKRRSGSQSPRATLRDNAAALRTLERPLCEIAIGAHVRTKREMDVRRRRATAGSGSRVLCASTVIRSARSERFRTRVRVRRYVRRRLREHSATAALNRVAHRDAIRATVSDDAISAQSQKRRAADSYRS